MYDAHRLITNLKTIMMKYFFGISLAFSLLISCAQSPVSASEKNTAERSVSLDSLQVAYFASGCFWCVEAVFESVEGVHEAISGYAGGDEKNPTYYSVSAGNSGHTETVQVYYDSSKVSYTTLLSVFFNSHDPSTLNRQGPDSGTQYRSAIFYQTDEEKLLIDSYIEALKNARTFSKITTEIAPLDIFYKAEEYHQDYERLNPNQGYVKAVSIPRLNKFKEKMPEVLKESAKIH